MRRFVTAILAIAAAHAVETNTWLQDTQDEFEKGNLKNISVRSDGRLTLAPVFREILDASAPYLWALAEDSKGNVYAGGGGPGGARVKLYQIDPAGKSHAIAEVEGLEIHAIALDRRDRVYGATSPDGKVYRIASGGKPELFYDPRAKYIWAMAFNSKGDLFIATGDLGEIHRVTPDGKGAVFFKTDETHARSLAIDKQDNLIIGTEPGGMILRVSPAGEGFVLHQAGKREVTAVAVAGDGSIYAAAVGTKSAPAPPPLAPAPAPPPPGPSPGGPGGAMTVRPVAAPPPTLTGAAPSVTGGSEVWRIDRDGFPRRVWNHAQDIVYAIGFDAQGHPLIGAGNKGSIYRLDTDVLATLLVNAQPTQVTAFWHGRQGRIYVATGNVGKVYQLGPELESQGSVESDVLDAQVFSYWGRLHWDGAAAGGKVSLETRSGNLDRPQKNWSQWAATNDRVVSPPARFLQWKLTMNGAPGGKSPEVNSVEVAWLPRNVAPVVERIEITPGNQRFPAPSALLSPSQNLTLPPIGQKRRPTPLGSSDSGSASMQYAKGYIGARWLATDQNGDAMTYTVEIRGAGEKEWKLLKDKIREKHLSWEATGLPDGDYVIRVTASDLPSNPPAQALTARAESESFVIDNTAPQIMALSARRNGARVEVNWKAADARSVLEKAEYSVNGGEWLPVLPTTRLADSLQHDYQVTLDNAPSGELTIAVRVADAWDNQAVDKVVIQ